MKKFTPIVAIVVIGGLIAFAISQGFNGGLLTSGVAVIAGLGGYAIKAKVVK